LSLSQYLQPPVIPPERIKQAKPPHIVVLLADDLGWGDVGWHHASGNWTPALTELARTGIELTRHYAYPICSPSRISFMTGRLPVHLDVSGYAWTTVLAPGDNEREYPGIPRSMTSIAEKLQEAGYVNHYVGKWDAGMATERHTPLFRGYTSFFGYFGHSIDYYTHQTINVSANHKCENMSVVDLWDNDKPAYRVAGKNYIEELFMDRSLQIIHAHDPRVPLFLVRAFHLVHTPLQPVANRSFAFTTCEKNRASEQGENCCTTPNERYTNMVVFLDAVVNKLVAALKARNLWQDTLLLFTSDNGGDILQSASNFPLKGGKTSFAEGGVRVNAFLSGGFLPQHARATKIHALVHISDWYATFAELAGVDASDPIAEAAGLPPVDSVSQWQVIAGHAKVARHDIYLGVDCLIFKHWKYIRNVRPKGAKEAYSEKWSGVSCKKGDLRGRKFQGGSNSIPEPCHTGCFFNIFTDPSERNNIAMAFPTNTSNIHGQQFGGGGRLLLMDLQRRLNKLNKANSFLAWQRELRSRGIRPMLSQSTCTAAHEYYGGFVGPVMPS